MNPTTTNPTKPTALVNFKTLLVSRTPADVRTSLSPKLALRERAENDTALALRMTRPHVQAKLQPLAHLSFLVTKTAGTLQPIAGTSDLKDLGTADVNLPYGCPRVVNVSTLKKLLKGKRSDVLLKRVGEVWEVCEDSLKVDLLDDSIEFRMGKVAIFS